MEARKRISWYCNAEKYTTEVTNIYKRKTFILQLLHPEAIPGEPLSLLTFQWADSRDLSPPCTAQLQWGLKGLGAGSPETTEKERASWRTKGGRRERKLPPTSTPHHSPRRKILPDWFPPMEKAQKWLCIILWTLCTCLPNHQIAGGFFLSKQWSLY